MIPWFFTPARDLLVVLSHFGAGLLASSCALTFWICAACAKQMTVNAINNLKLFMI